MISVILSCKCRYNIKNILVTYVTEGPNFDLCFMFEGSSIKNSQRFFILNNTAKGLFVGTNQSNQSNQSRMSPFKRLVGLLGGVSA